MKEPLRELYRGLASMEPAPDTLDRAECLLDGLIQTLPFEPGELEAGEHDLRSAAPEFADLGADGIPVVASAATRHLAVLAQQEGVWLGPFARVPFCHLAEGARIAELGHAYRYSPGTQAGFARMTEGVLRALGQPSGDRGSKAALRSLRLEETAYLLPDVLLTLAHSPIRYTPELLAVVTPTLTGALFSMPQWITSCVEQVVEETDGVEWPNPVLRQPAETDPLVQDALHHFTASGLATDGTPRFEKALRLLEHLVRLHRFELERACVNALRAPGTCMQDLVERKTPSARHAHGTAALDGRLLDEHFERSPEGNRDLMDALAASRWIRPGAADDSPFLTALTATHAPMGKIFSAEDIAIVRRWITWLADPVSTPLVTALTVSAPALPADPHPRGPAPAGFNGPQVRELFHDLVAGRDRGGTVRSAAAFVAYWLEAAQHMDKPAFSWELPERYDAESFPDWMHGTYQAMASAPVSALTDDGQAHHDRSFHGAADNLVDGGWLQGLTRRVELSDSERMLYDVYWDEIGNGKPGRSHGVLYEDVLIGLGHRLPKFWTRAFVDEVDSLDEGFYGPVLRLAIAEFPVSRFPEIVGVNLVCEFHGLGSAGISKANRLSGLGYDTSFTRLHIADDNVEMGHSAKSRDAVVFLMAQAARLGVTDLVWERVRRGATAMRMAYVVLMQERLNIAPTQVPAHLLNASDR